MPSKAVSVAVRCRPVLPHDKDQRVCVKTTNDHEIECLDPEHLHTELRDKHGRPDYLKENHCRQRAYTFDAVFGPSASNTALFEALAAPLVPEVLAGKHGTCFAYGQTGSGKTHTMLGRQGDAGMVERTLRALLREAAACESSVRFIFVEVYNERIRDLLSAKCAALDLRDDPYRGACIAGVSEEAATDAEAVMQRVHVGNSRRTEETTAANPVSSRSHAVLQLVVESPLPGAGAKRKRVAKLSLIDLAGSERAANTGNRGARLREGAMINRSLLALANCITALTRKGAYVNYRDSKLTRLLKDSLSGNCYTTMIAHCSPSISAFEETLNTLKYAHRACEIRGMCGGVRENICEVAVRYSDRLRPCMEATCDLKQAVAKLAVPRSNSGGGKPPPVPLQPAGAAGAAVALADALEATRLKVVSRMRERVRIEQTAIELEDQQESNAIELSRLELDAVLGGNAAGADGLQADAAAGVGGAAAGGSGGSGQVAKPVGSLAVGAALVTPAAMQADIDKAEDHLRLLKMHGALRAATRNNDAQRRYLERQMARAEQSADADGEGDKKQLVSLLTTAKAVIENDSDGNASSLEKRLLRAQHAMLLLEIEKVEADQGRAVLEAAARQRELALRKQELQLDVQSRALVVAEKLLAERGLGDAWRAALGPLAKLLPEAQPMGPGLDELIAELSEPTTPVASRPPTGAAPRGSPAAACAPADAEANAAPGDAALKAIDEGFNELRQSLSKSLKLPPPDALAPTGSEGDECEDDFYEIIVGSEDNDGDADADLPESEGGGTAAAAAAAFAAARVGLGLAGASPAEPCIADEALASARSGGYPDRPP